MEKQIERRVLPVRIEVRAADGESGKLVGYAALFNTLSLDLGGFKEQIAPGAFKNSLSADVRALIEHECELIIGRTGNGTLALTEDDKGLLVEITPPNTMVGKDAVENVRTGLLNQMSFGFLTNADRWDEIDGQLVRTLLDVTLLEVSIVSCPAYQDTTIACRAFNNRQKSGFVPDVSSWSRLFDVSESL